MRTRLAQPRFGLICLLAACTVGLAASGCATSKRHDFLAIRGAQLAPIPGDRSAYVPSAIFPTLAGFSDASVSLTAVPQH